MRLQLVTIQFVDGKIDHIAVPAQLFIQISQRDDGSVEMDMGGVIYNVYPVNTVSNITIADQQTGHVTQYYQFWQV